MKNPNKVQRKPLPGRPLTTSEEEALCKDLCNPRQCWDGLEDRARGVRALSLCATKLMESAGPLSEEGHEAMVWLAYELSDWSNSLMDEVNAYREIQKRIKNNDWKLGTAKRFWRAPLNTAK